MLANDELTLLIKSKYPVIFVESIDEEYVVNQLRQIASRLLPFGIEQKGTCLNSVDT
jgi:hypothetical protein